MISAIRKKAARTAISREVVAQRRQVLQEEDERAAASGVKRKRTTQTSASNAAPPIKKARNANGNVILAGGAVDKVSGGELPSPTKGGMGIRQRLAAREPVLIKLNQNKRDTRSAFEILEDAKKRKAARLSQVSENDDNVSRESRKGENIRISREPGKARNTTSKELVKGGNTTSKELGKGVNASKESEKEKSPRISQESGKREIARPSQESGRGQ